MIYYSLRTSTGVRSRPAGAQRNDDNGCAGAGWGAEPVCCGAACRVPSCPSEVWPNATRIHVDESAGCGDLLGGTADGVLCCKLQ